MLAALRALEHKGETLPLTPQTPQPQAQVASHSSTAKTGPDPTCSPELPLVPSVNGPWEGAKL